MNQEETRAAAKVMQAFADGKDIEYRQRNDQIPWRYIPAPSWDFAKCEYRIKPEATALSPRDDLYVVELAAGPTVEPYLRVVYTTLQQAQKSMEAFTPKEACSRVLLYRRVKL